MTEKILTPVEPERRFYSPRSGEDVERYADILDSPPDLALTEEQKTEVAAWNTALSVGHVNVGEQAFSAPVGTSFERLVSGKSYTAYELNLDYFASDEGRQSLRDRGLHLPANGSLKDLLATAFVGMPKEEAKDISQASKKAEDERMANQLVAGEIPTPPDRMRVFADSAPLLEALTGLRAYKQFFRQLRQPLAEAEPDQAVLAAKQTYIDMYVKVANNKLAELYPDALAFWYQAKHLPEPQRTIMVGAVEHAWPLLQEKRADYLRQHARRLFVRLDHLRNGASKDNAGAYVSIGQELQDYLVNRGKTAVETNQPTLFSPAEVAVMDQAIFDADDMRDMAEHLLGELGLLSEEKGYVDPTRPTRAADGKWQVVIRDDISAMGAEDPPGVLEIPAKFKRSLTKATAPVGALPGLAHEFAHIVQYENRRSQPGQGLGGVIKGKNQTVYNEAGSIRVEQWLQQTWFGRQREVGPHYAKAMLDLQAGKGEGEAIKTFYDSYRADNPNEDPKTAAGVAVSRVMRLARRKGGYDSQPLNYAETALLLEKTEHLTEHVKGLLFDYANFNIEDLAQLHRFDLLPKRIEHFPFEKFTDIIVPYIKAKLASNS